MTDNITTHRIRSEALAIAFQIEAHRAGPSRAPNADRAAEGKILCDALEALTGADDPQTRVQDAIQRIMHYAHAEGLFVDVLVENARFCFECDLNEGDG